MVREDLQGGGVIDPDIVPGKIAGIAAHTFLPWNSKHLFIGLVDIQDFSIGIEEHNPIGETIPYAGNVTQGIAKQIVI